MQSGVRTLAEMEASFDARRHARARLADRRRDRRPRRARRTKTVAQTDLQVIVELIRPGRQPEPIDKLENTLERDPVAGLQAAALHQCSPAFGLRVEVKLVPATPSLMLGYQRLKRWLALLLATAQQGRQPAAGDVRGGAPRHC